MADIVYAGATPQGTLGGGFLPANYDLVIYKGDYFPMVMTLTNPDGTPLNLTGYQGKAVLRANYTDATEFPFTVTLGGTNGKIQATLPSTVSSTLAPGSYVWDFQLTDPSGNVRTYVAGDVTVYDEVTK